MKGKTSFTALLLVLSLATVCAQAQSLKLPPMATGPFKPDWNSLTNYQVPEWFRDAKFGIGAHWGSQCQPEHGDWYARSMYETGSPNYKSHIVEYGHSSTNGFKDVIHVWKAEHFDPDTLLKFYQDSGAKYFMALASNNQNWPSQIGSVRLLGGGKLKFTRDENGLHVLLPAKFDAKTALALNIKS